MTVQAIQTNVKLLSKVVPSYQVSNKLFYEHPSKTKEKSTKNRMKV